ncbi:MAG: DinB family protein [Gemmatimonadota bacterium]|nr:DinB family protein [Gemmatimonadota bacterium]
MAIVLFAPSPTVAQYLGGGTKTANEVLSADLAQLRDKFLALADAIPADIWDWRPMPSVRSTRDVLILVTFEGSLFPTMWGFPSPEGVADGLQAEQERLGDLSPADLSTELRRSYDHVIGVVEALDDDDRGRQVDFFGLTTDLGTALVLMATDMHEHLGQLIAYARVNQVVPPWSEPPG